MNSRFGLEKHLINALIQWQAESLEVISNHFLNFFEQLLGAINASNEIFKIFIASFWSYLQKKNSLIIKAGGECLKITFRIERLFIFE